MCGVFAVCFGTTPFSRYFPLYPFLKQPKRLISLGFVTSFSALFSKTWRLRRLYAAGRRCQRITLAPKDVMLPFIVLLTLNVTLLVAWTIVAPLTWERVPLDNFDEHGRTVESVGSCRANDDLETQVLPFAILILLISFHPFVFSLCLTV